MTAAEEDIKTSQARAPGGTGRATRLGISGWLRWSWRQLTSMRTALILLFLLALASVPGSVLPQEGIDPAAVNCLPKRQGKTPQQYSTRSIRPQPHQCLGISLDQHLSKSGEEGNLLALHPTVKPVALIADALLDCSARGDIVLDAFLGSGSTLIAAERTGRVCCGIELDPLYVDTAIRRWQRHTGDHAVHAVSGKRFDDVASERLEAARG